MIASSRAICSRQLPRLAMKELSVPNFRQNVQDLSEEYFPRVMEMRKAALIPDVESYIKTWKNIDPQGIKIALTESGDLIGTLGCVQNHENLFMSGFYAIREQYRGVGAGRELWDRTMERVGSRNMALNVQTIDAKIYQKEVPILESQFSINYCGTMGPPNPHSLENTLPEGIAIDPYESQHLQSIYDFDQKVVNFDRSRLIELSCSESQSVTLVATQNSKCVGFGSIKPSCLAGTRVGPLYADDPLVAEVLLRRLILAWTLPMANLMMTTLNTAGWESRRLADKIGCMNVYTLVRLYKLCEQKADIRKIYSAFDASFSVF